MIETVTDGVRFFEGMPPKCDVIAPIETRIVGVVTSSQLKSLTDVKKLMAAEAKILGGDAVVQFQYGQRTVGFFASLLLRDDVMWYGSGNVAKISNE